MRLEHPVSILNKCEVKNVIPGRRESFKFMKQSYVYIMANKKRGVLHIGVTSDLIKRVYEHKNNVTPGFTKKYNIHNLVYYEIHADINEAITREKQMKKWYREWKIELNENNNPELKDLYNELI